MSNQGPTRRGGVPLVRPPPWAGGTGPAPLGQSGAPGMPQPGTQRAADLSQQLADAMHGRFTERVYRFPDFGVIASTATAPPQQIQITGTRSNFVRLVALRGGLANAQTTPLTGLELGGLALRLSINGTEDLTTNGQGTIPAEFDGLFSPIAPWFWFSAPPRLRISDQLQATITNNFNASGEGSGLTPYLLARIVDDAWWRALYGT